MISKRTTILLLITLGASIPFGLLLWRRSLPCKDAGLGQGYQQVLVQDSTGMSFLPCPMEDPTRVSTAIIVLTWMTFGFASLSSATLDAADFLHLQRSSRADDAWLNG